MYHERFKGTHYEIGINRGSRLLKNNRCFLDNVPFEITKERRDFALQCLPLYQKYFPEIIEESSLVNNVRLKQYVQYCSVCIVSYLKLIVLVL